MSHFFIWKVGMRVSLDIRIHILHIVRLFVYNIVYVSLVCLCVYVRYRGKLENNKWRIYVRSLRYTRGILMNWLDHYEGQRRDCLALQSVLPIISLIITKLLAHCRVKYISCMDESLNYSFNFNSHHFYFIHIF